MRLDSVKGRRKRKGLKWVSSFQFPFRAPSRLHQGSIKAQGSKPKAKAKANANAAHKARHIRHTLAHTHTNTNTGHATRTLNAWGQMEMAMQKYR